MEFIIFFGLLFFSTILIVIEKFTFSIILFSIFIFLISLIFVVHSLHYVNVQL